MEARYPGIIEEDEAGDEGEMLELCKPVIWPGLEYIDESYVKALISRLVSASYREPELLNMFALRKSCLTRILVFAKECFAKEKTLVDVLVPHHGQVHVFGDTHGDIHSLMEGLTKTGLPGPGNILCFAGDCVDRGSWGVEVLTILFVLKLWKPECVYIVRGNHETSGCATRYGFEQEVLRKYDDRMFKTFVKSFRELPCAAVVRTLLQSKEQSEDLIASAANSQTSVKKDRKGSGTRPKRKSKVKTDVEDISEGEGWRRPLLPGERRILVLHGGLFRSWKDIHKGSMALGDLEDLAEAHRQVDDPIDSIVEDVVWSDPQLLGNDVTANALRGAGILYGQGAVEAFFKRNNLHGMLRAHEGPDMREKRPEMNDMLDGYSLDMELVSGYLVTVFSTANYPPDMPRGNKGAIATILGRGVGQCQMLPEFVQFDKRFSPQDCTLFYQPENTSNGATPRNSFSS